MLILKVLILKMLTLKMLTLNQPHPPTTCQLFNHAEE